MVKGLNADMALAFISLSGKMKSRERNGAIQVLERCSGFHIAGIIAPFLAFPPMQRDKKKK